MRRQSDERSAVFVISVASRLTGLHPSTLRKYEGCGLLEPCRRSGRLRLYSPQDIARLRQIRSLVDDRGVNVKGVELALAVTERLKPLVRVVRNLPDEAQREAAQLLLADSLRLLGAEPSGPEPTGAMQRGTPERADQRDPDQSNQPDQSNANANRERSN